jgi:IS4 transposase
LKELYGWEHVTALRSYLENHPQLRVRLGFETVPDQSTLWRNWHSRFTIDLQELIATAARTILIKADDTGVSIPREPSRQGLRRGEDSEDDERSASESHCDLTSHLSQVVFPAFSLDRGAGCEIHENAFWSLQTYLGLRENLAANEGARSFTYESTRERTPLGHNHRARIRDLSIEQIREMYRDAAERLVNRAAETCEFFRAGCVAIDTTDADPFTGDRTGHEDEIIGTKEQTDEYAYQWATIQLVGDSVPLVLDARPVRKGDTRLEIVEDLLDSAMDLVTVDRVLMDREFDSQHILEAIADSGLTYVVPKRMQTSEKAQAKRLLERDQDRYVTDRKLHLGSNEWHETTLQYRRQKNSDRTDYRQYAVFLTNATPGAIAEYTHRWDIERGYKSIKRFMAATTSKDFVLRFFYFAFACLLYSIWRAVDLLVQVQLTGGYDREPVVTAENTLTLLKKQTGIG